MIQRVPLPQDPRLAPIAKLRDEPLPSDDREFRKALRRLDIREQLK